MMMTEPLVSVVIPVYNRKTLLLRAIDSVLAQTFSNFEIIVIDDCSSTDISSLLVEYYLDERLRCERLPENVGCGLARNHGIKGARGTYVAFLDSDDSWEPEKLEAQLTDIALAGRPDDTFSFSRFRLHDGIGTKILPARGPNIDEPIDEYLFCGSGPIHTSSVIASRALLLKHQFLPLRQGEDDELWLRLGAVGACVVFTSRSLSSWNAESRRTDRLCNSWTFRDGSDWIRQYGRLLSPKAQRAWYARRLAPELIRVGSFRQNLQAGYYIVRSFLWLDLAPRVAFHLLLRLLLPAYVYDSMRRFARSRVK